MSIFRNKKHTLPGFNLTLGYTVFYLGVVVLIPLAGLFLKSFDGTIVHAWKSISGPEVVASYKLSFGASLIAALVNGVFGFITAWVFTRYEFFGRRIFDAFVDLPFALPTAVAGIALTELYAPHGWLGRCAEHFGIKVAYTPLGIGVALIFIGFPFVVRTVQPVIAGLSQEVEEAAACLGASRSQTFFRVVFPAVLPALLTGITLAFGRAVGEYGSVVFISANLPFKTEITPVLIVSKLEQYDYQGAAAIGVVMLIISLAILSLVNLIQWWSGRRTGHVLTS
ncbi:MAG: sulfate ABC transporter permease subunit CysT [Chthoniobacteraceae bacterium]